MTQSTIREIGTVLLPVADQDRALDFYLGNLGFETRTDTAYGEGQRWVEIAPPGAATTIALVPPTERRPAGGVSGVVLRSEDIDADHAAMVERGVDCDELMRSGGPVPPMFWFRDQDANTLLLVQRTVS
jgi:catechol 2,3-dioxygenase-like lactoylglutathione lyase family enzyme